MQGAAADIAQNPAVIYVGILAAVVTGLATAVPQFAKIFGPLGRWWIERGERQRRLALDRDDADILELKRQVRNLERWRAEKEKRDELHAQWDWDTYQRANEAGIRIKRPPLL